MQFIQAQYEQINSDFLLLGSFGEKICPEIEFPRGSGNYGC